MPRYTPQLLQRWTEGELFQTPSAALQMEREYKSISTDTRTIEDGSVFVALCGEHFDGHTFAEKALASGASMLVLNHNSPISQNLLSQIAGSSLTYDLLLVDDTLKAYQNMARAQRIQLAAYSKLVGITGSVGKTTTRRMIAAALSGLGQICETPANLNNEIGLPKTLLSATEEDEIILTEMAMDHPGEIATLGKIACPDIAVITSVGYSHIEYLGSRERILEEKTSIIDDMRENPHLILNADDDFLLEWALKLQPNNGLTSWMIASETNGKKLMEQGYPVFWSEKLELHPEYTEFDCHCSQMNSQEAIKVKIPAPGHYLVPAALFAMATAFVLGYNLEEAAKNLLGFANTGSRQRISHLPKQGVTLIDDSYNAAPESMIAGIDTLELLGQSTTQGRTLAVLAGMRELGAFSQLLHEVVAKRLLDSTVSQVYLLGTETTVIRDYLAKQQCSIPVTSCTDINQLIEVVSQEIQVGDVVLLKGSHSYKLGLVATEIEEREKTKL